MPPSLYKAALNIYLIRIPNTADTVNYQNPTLTAKIDLKSKLAITRQYRQYNNLLG